MKALSTIFFLFVFFTASAQEVKLSWEKRKILLGEPMQLKLEAVVAPGQVATFFHIDTLPHFEILERSETDSIQVGSNWRLKQTATVTSWDSGRWTVPTVMQNMIPAQPIQIDVVYTSPFNVAQPYHDIKGIVPVAPPEDSVWWWYVIGLAVLIALFMLFFPAGKREETGIVKLDAGAYRKAMQALDSLQGGQLSPKAYYTELVHIFRTYLKAAKGIESFSKTTDDLSIQLQSQKLPYQLYNELLQTLRTSDLVKFAEYVPPQAIAEASFAIIRQSITEIEKGNAV